MTIRSWELNQSITNSMGWNKLLPLRKFSWIDQSFGSIGPPLVKQIEKKNEKMMHKWLELFQCEKLRLKTIQRYINELYIFCNFCIFNIKFLSKTVWISFEYLFNYD